MGRVMAIDYGTRRVGIAVTDPGQMIATPLTTIDTATLFAFLKTYMQHEVVDMLVVGLPKRLQNTPSSMTVVVQKFIKTLQRTFFLGSGGWKHLGGGVVFIL